MGKYGSPLQLLPDPRQQPQQFRRRRGGRKVGIHLDQVVGATGTLGWRKGPWAVWLAWVKAYKHEEGCY